MVMDGSGGRQNPYLSMDGSGSGGPAIALADQIRQTSETRAKARICTNDN